MWGEYESKGLVVLALSDEGGSTVEPYVEKHGLTYPTGAGSGSKRGFKVGGIPAGFLIDHTGIILWSGHPGSNDWVGMLDKALLAAENAKPNWDPGERPELLKKAVKFAKAGELGKAWKESENCRKKAVDSPGSIEAIDLFQTDFLTRAATRTATLDEFYNSGTYFLATEFLEEQMAVFKGSPPEAEWKAMVKSWSKDKEIKTLLDLDKKRVKAMEMAWGGKADKAQAALLKLRKKAKGTIIFDTIQGNLEAVASM
ncbi:MAG: hypothetical protein GY747_11820 [Planctomycetes bacterium]|nr:hypothetical protein [Planctomycetota bacterium]MCP4772592.1 hypothetical protein [Planctomycetota bacterium]MCP4860902.1 hypothetical protein [Planctomycetota bacterium]